MAKIVATWCARSAARTVPLAISWATKELLLAWALRAMSSAVAIGNLPAAIRARAKPARAVGVVAVIAAKRPPRGPGWMVGRNNATHRTHSADSITPDARRAPD